MNLKDYIRGQRRGKEANQLERKAMDDPFLQDAIDGYDLVEGDHLSVIEKLEKQFTVPKKRTNQRIWIWVAAAVVVLLIGIPLLLYKPHIKEGIPMVSTELPIKAIPHGKDSSTSLLQSDSLLLAERSDQHKRQEQHEQPERSEQSTVSEQSKQSGRSQQTQQTQLPHPSGHSQQVEPVRQSDNNRQVQPVQQSERAHRSERALQSQLTQESEQALYSQLEKQLETEKNEEKETIQFRGVSSLVPQSDKLFVSGRIVDETGEPLPGVTINIPDTRTGTVTDFDGNFKLLIPEDEKGTLVASYIGMEETEIPLKEDAGDIIMKSNDLALSEVVVTGYGSKKKINITGAISRMKKASKSEQENGPVFGEEEFREFFTENYDKEICAGQKITIVVELFIDPLGQPGQINIKENSCPALENEIKRLLLGSPAWSKVNRKATLTIELP